MPVRRSSASRSTSPDPHIPCGATPPMVRQTTPPSPISTDSTAPSYPGMPYVISPPSNAGPAGHDAAIMPCRFPTTTSVFVPTSTSITTSSSSSMPMARRSAVTSAPTWQPTSGPPYTFAPGNTRNPSSRAVVFRDVPVRSPRSISSSISDL